MISHRAYRDISRCREKYGPAWEEYTRRVPYLFIPVRSEPFWRVMKILTCNSVCVLINKKLIFRFICTILNCNITLIIDIIGTHEEIVQLNLVRVWIVQIKLLRILSILCRSGACGLHSSYTLYVEMFNSTSSSNFISSRVANVEYRFICNSCAIMMRPIFNASHAPLQVSPTC
jgi:Ergosterol biosynthesis ERG4/ERG24 family